jgi:hypothetical protein
MTSSPDVAASCVVDDVPAIWSSVVPWLATAIELARIPPSRIHVHHVCPLRPSIAGLCRALGVPTHEIAPFDPRYPHANKIRQCSTAFGGVGRVVLTDVDVVFAGRPRFGEIRTPVAGKLVDGENPPLDILKSVFSAAGVPLPSTSTNAYLRSRNSRVTFETLPGNCNGGMYVIHRDQLARVGRSWSFWASWLIDRIDLLGRWALHVDQVSFCLAVNHLRMPISLLDEAWNFPLHIDVAGGDTEPVILHHHARFHRRQRLRQPSAPQAREAVARVNAVVESFRRKHLSAPAPVG